MAKKTVPLFLVPKKTYELFSGCGIYQHNSVSLSLFGQLRWCKLEQEAENAYVPYGQALFPNHLLPL